MSRQFPEAPTAPIRNRTLSLSVQGHVNLRLSFSVLRHHGSTRAVVATSSASVNADYDNGIGLHHTTRRRRAHEHGAKRVEASVGENDRPDLIPWHISQKYGAELRKSGPFEYKMGKQCG